MRADVDVHGGEAVIVLQAETPLEGYVLGGMEAEKILPTNLREQGGKVFVVFKIRRAFERGTNCGTYESVAAADTERFKDGTREVR